MKYAHSVLLLSLALPAGCGPAGRPDEAVPKGETVHQGDLVKGTGTVTWYEVEGGFYAIRGDDGTTYDPINLPVRFRKDGLRVYFEARLRTDLLGAHMAGPLVEILKIVET